MILVRDKVRWASPFPRTGGALRAEHYDSRRCMAPSASGHVAAGQVRRLPKRAPVSPPSPPPASIHVQAGAGPKVTALESWHHYRHDPRRPGQCTIANLVSTLMVTVPGPPGDPLPNARTAVRAVTHQVKTTEFNYSPIHAFRSSMKDPVLVKVEAAGVDSIGALLRPIRPIQAPACRHPSTTTSPPSPPIGEALGAALLAPPTETACGGSHLGVTPMGDVSPRHQFVASST
jgi:hypothetical protein